jgi:hypothetical protein
MNQELLADFDRRIVETAQPEKINPVRKPGSGDARPDSDFDVLVIKESDEPGYRRAAAFTWRWRDSMRRWTS